MQHPKSYKTGSAPGLFGNYLPTVNGEKRVCAHWHRTPGGAESCAKGWVRWQKRVDAFKAKTTKPPAAEA